MLSVLYGKVLLISWFLGEAFCSCFNFSISLYNHIAGLFVSMEEKSSWVLGLASTVEFSIDDSVISAHLSSWQSWAFLAISARFL